MGFCSPAQYEDGVRSASAVRAGEAGVPRYPKTRTRFAIWELQAPCPVGHEHAEQSLVSWQPKVCRNITKLAKENGVSVVGCDYWDAPGMPDAMRRLCPVDRGFVGHSGEFETSVQMHLQSELVDAHQAVWAPGAFGDPSAGSEEKGKALIEAAVEGLVRLLQSYHNGELEDRFVWRKEAPVR
jgi:hypothetical protein